MCPNSISHSPSGSVLTSPSSWKEVGNPQCWEGPGWPLWATGDQFCQEGVRGYRQRSCVVSASLAHGTEPHHRLQAHTCCRHSVHHLKRNSGKDLPQSSIKAFYHPALRGQDLPCEVCSQLWETSVHPLPLRCTLLLACGE